MYYIIKNIQEMHSFSFSTKEKFVSVPLSVGIFIKELTLGGLSWSKYIEQSPHSNTKIV